MEPIEDLSAHSMLAELVSVVRLSLGNRLTGVYLYGSWATGDFVAGRSDVDLLMVLETGVDAETLRSLIDVHRRFDADHEAWRKRIDVAYVGRAALETFRSEPYAVIVSDHEAVLTLVDAPRYYLIDWFKVQEHGIVVSGPAVGDVMPSISVVEFTQAVRDYLRSCPAMAAGARRRGEQAYVILTVCRSLYACTFAVPASKETGAAWSMGAYPHWRELITKGLAWNRNPGVNDVLDEHHRRATIDFVEFMVGEATR